MAYDGPSGPYTIVNDSFEKADGYAASATALLSGFTSALNASIYAPPTVSVAWNSPAAPSLTSIGAVPDMPTIAFNTPAGEPTALSETIPTIDIADFTVADPTLSFPTAPTLSYGTTPLIPSVGEVLLPDAPVVAMPDTPTFLALNTISFGGIDIHSDWLAKLESIPTLDLLSPTPYSYALGAEYASELLSALQAKLVERMAGGTGLAPAVEQALWDRARSRETTIAQANQDEIMRASEALGFALPAGVLAAQLREAQQGYYDKLSTLSRDISIKQAELEQENLKQTISQGMELESKLIDYSYKLEQLTFETAKQYADNAIQVYNAATEQYKALLSAYQVYASAYKTIIDAEMTKVEVYKAELMGEQTKSQINGTLVAQYKAQIEAGMAQVEIYRAQVGGAQTLVQLEQAKIGAAGEQIRAYVAQINVETSKVEAYKAGVQAEATKIEVYKAQTQAYSARASAQAEKARAQISWYGALSQAKAAEWDGYKTKIGAETARIQALGLQSSSLVDGFKAGAAASEAQGNINARMWESSIKQYEAGQNLALQTAKINGDFTITTNNARLDAAKTGAQVYAQLTSSAYSMIHASAGVSGSSSMSVGYSYSNDTTDAVAPVTSI
jgi:hypothetical protein